MVQHGATCSKQKTIKKYATQIFGPCTRVHTDRKKAVLIKNDSDFATQEISLKKFLIALCHTNACASCFEQNYDCAPPQETFITLFQKQQNQILNFKLNWRHCWINVQSTKHYLRISTWDLFCAFFIYVRIYLKVERLSLPASTQRRIFEVHLLAENDRI